MQGLHVMQKVYSHESLALVNSAKNLLALKHIDCFIKNEFMGSGGHVGLGTALIELWVFDDAQVTVASSLIEDELIKVVEAPAWQCLHCGEENDSAFESCWKCQRSP